MGAAWEFSKTLALQLTMLFILLIIGMAFLGFVSNRWQNPVGRFAGWTRREASGQGTP